LNDEAFLGQITFPDLRKLYSDDVHSRIRAASSEFNKVYDSRRDAYQRGFETQKEHDKILNLAIHPFVEKSSPGAGLGYTFVRAAPLLELGIPNVDFLLYKPVGKVPIAIFGEVKSTVTNYARVLKEFEDRKKVIIGNLDHVKSNYLKTSVDPILEYVLVVKSSIATKTRDAAFEKGGGLIIWQGDLYDIGLGLVPPPPGLKSAATISWVHHDHELNRVLSTPVRSNAAALAFFPQSHPITKLNALIPCMRMDAQKQVVPYTFLNAYLAEQMPYLGSAERSKEFEFICSTAVEIGLAGRSQSRPELDILSARKKPSSLEAEIHERWVESRLGAEKKEQIENARVAFQNEILSEQKRRPTLV
jgi:hypothetical protein